MTYSEAFIKKNKFYFHHDINIHHSSSHVGDPHYHVRFEIYFITEGSCIYFIKNQTYQLEKGDIVLIPSGTMHSTKYDNSTHSRMLINCSEEFIPSAIRPFLPELIYLYRNPNIYNEVYDLFKKIEKEYTSPNFLTENILVCYTHNLFYLLTQKRSDRIIVPSKNETIEKALDYLQKNFCSKISLDEIAKLFSVSSEHFSRLFKKETGFGFNKYLNTLRLQKAETLLKSLNKKTITEIALECGFSDANYFSNLFKENYGIPPKKFQQSAHKLKP